MAGDNSIYTQLGLETPPAYVNPYNQADIDAIPVDMSGVTAYRQQALRTGPSTWANLSDISNAANTANQKETAQKAAAGQTAAAENNLAASGGLSSGARERAQESGATNYLDMSQNLDRQQNLNDLQTGINDETNRIQQLGNLGNVENQALQPLYQKAQLTAQNQQGQNSYNMNIWNGENQAIAANQQANAISNSAPSCWLISAYARYGKLPSDEPELLTQFKIAMYDAKRDVSLFYMKKCGPLIKKMDKAGFDWVGFSWFNTSLMALLRAGKYSAAFDFFQTVVHDLINQYWPDCPAKIVKDWDNTRAFLIEHFRAGAREAKFLPKEFKNPCLTNVKKDRFEESHVKN